MTDLLSAQAAARRLGEFRVLPVPFATSELAPHRVECHQTFSGTSPEGE